MEQSPLQNHVQAVLTLQELVDVANELLPGYLPKDTSGRAAEGVNPRLVRFYTTEGLVPEPHKEGREARYVFGHLLHLLLVRKLLAEGFGSSAIRKTIWGRQREELLALLSGDVRVELAPSQSVAESVIQADETLGVMAEAAEYGDAQPKLGIAELSRPLTAEPDTAPAAGPAALPASAPVGADSRSDFLAKLRAKAGLDSPKGGAANRSRAAGQSQPPADTPAFLRREQNLLGDYDRGVRSWRQAPQHSQTPSQVQLPPTQSIESTWSRLTVQDGLELSVRDDFRWPGTQVGEDQVLQQLRVALLQLEQARRKRKP